MSRLTASIMRINQELDKISGLDGVATDRVEALEQQVRDVVEGILTEFEESPDDFTLFKDYVLNEYLPDAVKELQNNPSPDFLVDYSS